MSHSWKVQLLELIIKGAVRMISVDDLEVSMTLVLNKKCYKHADSHMWSEISLQTNTTLHFTTLTKCYDTTNHSRTNEMAALNLICRVYLYLRHKQTLSACPCVNVCFSGVGFKPTTFCIQIIFSTTVNTLNKSLAGHLLTFKVVEWSIKLSCVDIILGINPKSCSLIKRLGI